MAYSSKNSIIKKKSSINKKKAAPDSEIHRAISYGFVPSELLGDWDKTVTFSQYCSMLTDMLSRYDSKLVPQWKKTASRALASNAAMHRDHVNDSQVSKAVKLSRGSCGPGMGSWVTAR